MVRAIMHGCNGHMGQVITGLIKADEGIELVAGIDKYTGIANDYPVFESLEKCDVEADVIIDFSNAAAADALLTYCEEKKNAGCSLHDRSFRRTTCKDSRSSKENSSFKICKYVSWYQSSDEIIKRSNQSSCTGRI